VDVQAQAGLKSGTVEQNEITFTMKVETFSLPGLEMRIAFAASSTGRRYDWRATDTREGKNESVWAWRYIMVTGLGGSTIMGIPKRIDLMAPGKRAGGRNV
jgi:hypothetical protein